MSKQQYGGYTNDDVEITGPNDPVEDDFDDLLDDGDTDDDDEWPEPEDGCFDVTDMN